MNGDIESGGLKVKRILKPTDATFFFCSTATKACVVFEERKMNKKWITQSAGGAVLTLHIVPRSSRTEICGEHGDALKIKLQAPPIEGKANKALIEFLSDKLDIPRNSISILSGDTGRNKRIIIKGISTEKIHQLLAS